MSAAMRSRLEATMELRERYLYDTIVERNLTRRANQRQLRKIENLTGEQLTDIPSLSKLISVNHRLAEMFRECTSMRNRS